MKSGAKRRKSAKTRTARVKALKKKLAKGESTDLKIVQVEVIKLYDTNLTNRGKTKLKPQVCPKTGKPTGKYEYRYKINTIQKAS